MHEPQQGFKEKLEDLEDIYIALQRLENPEKYYSMEEAIKHLHLNEDKAK